MTIKELHNMNFNDAAEELYQENDLVTTYDTLKDFAIDLLQKDNVGYALHILNAIYNTEGDYYDYDYSMGTMDTPTPLLVSADLEDYCTDGGKTK